MPTTISLDSGHTITILNPNESRLGRTGVWEVRVEGASAKSLAERGLTYHADSSYSHIHHHLAMDLMPEIGREAVDRCWRQIEEKLQETFNSYKPYAHINVHYVMVLRDGRWNYEFFRTRDDKAKRMSELFGKGQAKTTFIQGEMSLSEALRDFERPRENNQVKDPRPLFPEYFTLQPSS